MLLFAFSSALFPKKKKKKQQQTNKETKFNTASELAYSSSTQHATDTADFIMRTSNSPNVFSLTRR